MLGETLKIRRQELGITIQDMSRMTGMAPKKIIALEENRADEFTLAPKELERLLKLYARKLNMSLPAVAPCKTYSGHEALKSGSQEVSIPLFLLSSSEEVGMQAASRSPM